MKQNEKQTSERRRKTPKKIALTTFIVMLKAYPLLFNVYLTALIIEWWCFSDKISPFIYPVIGNCMYIIILFYVGSYAFNLCGIYRFWLINSFIWVAYEWLYNLGFEISNFLIAISTTTTITFIATILIIIRQWIRKIKIAKT